MIIIFDELYTKSEEIVKFHLKSLHLVINTVSDKTSDHALHFTVEGVEAV